MAERNLTSGDWTSITSASALEKAYDLADARAAWAIDWYDGHMRWRGRAARWLRFVALLLVGLGTIFPIGKGFVPGLKDGALNDLGYLALALGGALLAFDHFFGITTAYTRFVTTALALRDARLRFQVDWLRLLAQARSGSGSAATRQAALWARLRSFVEAVLTLIDRETQAWVVEFRSSLSELEKLARREPDRHGEEDDAPGAAPAATPAPARLQPGPGEATPPEDAPVHLVAPDGSFPHPDARP
ncbi:MAG: SLATT domain-containing protein [Anaeromyxobacter sp.]